MRFSALTGLQCNHASCLGKQAYHAAVMIALRRLHRLRLKNMHCQSAHNTKPKTQHIPVVYFLKKQGSADSSI